MAYESKGTFYEFPHSEFNEEHPQIYHTNLCCISMEQMDMECTLTQEVEINEKKNILLKKMKIK
ncbi:hypothetical protein [Paenibacillus polymyxa]|uniref:hypothetical protein n=1 Tax=Paenibacillus polymyxa TaxID=1406 RepID=UPI002ED2C09C